MFAIKGMKDATTSRPASSAILAIDSEDRFKDYVVARAAGDIGYNNSPYNFQISKNESMMNGFFTRLALTEVNFPWAIPNINVSTRDIGFEYQIGANPPLQLAVEIDYGFFTPAEIAAAIELVITTFLPALGFQMKYAGAPFGLGDAENIPIFSYTAGIGNSCCFLPLPANSVVYPYPATTKQLFDLLGFTDDNTILGGGVSFGKFSYAQAIRYIDIVCNQLTYNQAVKDTMSQTITRDTLCRLYLGDGPYTGTSTVSPSDPDFCPPGCAPFTIYRQFTNPKFIRWMNDQPVQGNLQFEVFDDSGIRLDAVGALGQETDTANWSMTLLVSED
jgi:hypothetical protein